MTAGEASLINGVEFLDELARFEPQAGRAPDSGLDPRVYADAFDGLDPRVNADAFDGLDSGLPMIPAASQIAAPHHERAPFDLPYGPLADAPRSAEQHIPFMTAALILVACLTLGAATAMLVFYDQVGQITALRTATR